MNDPVMLMVGGRVVERLVIAIGGIVCLWLGYKLFFLAASKSQDITNMEAGGHGFSFKAERIGPGVFFALFGSLLLGYAAFTRIDVSTESIRSVANASKTVENQPGTIVSPSMTEKVATVVRGLQDSSVGELPQSVKAANSLILLRQIQLDTKEPTLSKSGYETFMRATAYLTEIQRTYVEQRYGVGVFDTVLDMKRKCDNGEPACDAYRSDPSRRKQMDSVLSDLATGVS